jgi:hypothetical protein
MGKSPVRNAAVRGCVAFLVIGIHVAVLIIPWDRQAQKRTDPSALTWVNVDAPSRPLPAAVPATATSKPKTRARWLPDSPVVRPADTAPAVPVPPVDWHASVEAAAKAAAEQIAAGELYRPFGPTDREEADSSSAPSIFEEPRRRAGDIDHDEVQGSTLVWHNDHCYTELRFPTLKDPNAVVGLSNPPKCMQPIGKRKPRGDLFDAMKAP